MIPPNLLFYMNLSIFGRPFREKTLLAGKYFICGPCEMKFIFAVSRLEVIPNEQLQKVPSLYS
jgi:hypothetical protein